MNLTYTAIRSSEVIETIRKGLILGFIFFLLASPLGITSCSAEPFSSLELTIPDYTVTTQDDLDYVEIPGGEILLEEGRPRVPYYVKPIDYPKGYRVQNVVMAGRSTPLNATGLNLTTVTNDPNPSSENETSSIEHEGWYPEKDFDWKLWTYSDGSSTLVISMYPFSYNPETTDVKFYRNYRFDIEYILSDVAINELYTDKDIYEPGEDVMIDMQFTNTGETKDVIVNAVIKQYGTDEIVDGLSLRTLKDFNGEGSWSAVWSTDDIELGYYYVEVTLTDTSGNRLDRKTAGFGLDFPMAIEDGDEGNEENEDNKVKQENEEKGFPWLEPVLIIVIVCAIVLGMIMLRKRRKIKS